MSRVQLFYPSVGIRVALVGGEIAPPIKILMRNRPTNKFKPKKNIVGPYIIVNIVNV